MATQAQSAVHLPRVEIKFCVQCKWNLRAAYYAQELLQTFANTIGEIALVPVTGGTFTITVQHNTAETSTTSSSERTGRTSSISLIGEGPFALSDSRSRPEAKVTTTQVWDRKTDGGFPETKELKNRIRNLIDPQRDMGHIDRSLNKAKTTTASTTKTTEHENGAAVKKQEYGGGTSGHHGAGDTERRIQPVVVAARRREHGLGEDEDDGDDEAGMHDCEECRLAAREALEDEIGRVTSGY